MACKKSLCFESHILLNTNNTSTHSYRYIKWIVTDNNDSNSSNATNTHTNETPTMKYSQNKRFEKLLGLKISVHKGILYLGDEFILTHLDRKNLSKIFR